MKETKHRENIYKIIHKYARAEINRVTVLAGCTDPANDQELNHFKQEFADLIAFLNDHAFREEKYIHPLIKESNSIELDLIEKEHHQLDSMLNNLQDFLKVPLTHEHFYQFYLDLIVFQSAYYNHLNNEERKLFPYLHENSSDEQLDKVNSQLLKEIPQEAVVKITKVMLPVINHAERVKIFSEIKATAPQQVLVGMRELAHSVLTANQFNKLLNDACIND